MHLAVQSGVGVIECQAIPLAAFVLQQKAMKRRDLIPPDFDEDTIFIKSPSLLSVSLVLDSVVKMFNTSVPKKKQRPKGT